MSDTVPSPPQIDSLPKEIIYHITSYLTPPDIVAISRTSRRYVPFATDRNLWRELNVGLPAQYGELPLVQPHAKTDDADEADPYRVWARDQAERAEERRQYRLREKIKAMVNKAEEARWALVRDVALVPRPGSAIGMTYLLDCVSPYLDVLRMSGSTQSHFSHTTLWEGQLPQTLEATMIQSRIFLPALTAVHLGQDSIHDRSFINLLVSMAPNLTAVDLDFTRSGFAEPHGWTPLPYFPEITSPTKITNLRFVIADSGGDQDYESTMAVFTLIEHCPKLRQLSATYWTILGIETEVVQGFIAALTHVDELEDLYLSFDQYLSPLVAALPLPACASLRRLIVAVSNDWEAAILDMLTCVPALPRLKKIYFSKLIEHPSLESTYVSPPRPPVHAIPYILATEIRACPQLSVFDRLPTAFTSHTEPFTNVDEYEKTTQRVGNVRSYIHGEDELLHAQVFIDIAQVPELPAGGPGFQNPLPDGNGGEQTVCYSPLRNSCWQDWTDFRGRVVPLEVIERMRGVQGTTESGWKGRGVKVGDEAWAVLTAWIDGQKD